MKFHKETKASAVMSLHWDIKDIKITSLKPYDAVLNSERYITVKNMKVPQNIWGYTRATYLAILKINYLNKKDSQTWKLESTCTY